MDEQVVPAEKKPKAPKRVVKKRKTAIPAVVPARLAVANIEKARATSKAWDRHTRYSMSDYFVHTTFGVGYVMIATDEFITCLFEGGETRRLIHAR